MTHLREAVRKRFSGAALLQYESDLDPLRAREDFQELLRETAKQSPPKP